MTIGSTRLSLVGSRQVAPRQAAATAARPLDGRPTPALDHSQAAAQPWYREPSRLSLDTLVVPPAPMFSYTTHYAHPLAELAAQLGTTVEDLCAVNGWSASRGPIPAGTTIQVPDTPATRAAATAYGEPIATAAPAAATTAAGTTVPADPNTYFMTQSQDPHWNPNGPDKSADCGPTSLAMALLSLGLAPQGSALPADPSQYETYITAVRQAMLPGSGHEDGTDVGDVMRGARAAGARAAYVNSADEVERALREGKQVVLSGDPVAYNGRFPDMFPYDGGHFILVTGVKGEGAEKRYIISDPLSHTGSVEITQQELEQYMAYQGWNSGVAVWKDQPATPLAGTPGAPAGDCPLSAQTIATAIDAPVENVTQYLPYIWNAMKAAGMTDPRELVAVMATVKAENWNFAPMTEDSDGSAYEGRADLGNTQPGDGARFIGRGFIQITGRGNYETYGKELGIDLVDNPELANDPQIAARILVQYFQDNGVDQAALSGDWRKVRLLVNGGYNGWDVFSAAVDGLSAALNLG